MKSFHEGCDGGCCSRRIAAERSVLVVFEGVWTSNVGHGCEIGVGTPGAQVRRCGLRLGTHLVDWPGSHHGC